MRQAGAINEEQYNLMCAAATKAKDETIGSANTQYDSIYATTTSKLGDTSKYINSETGAIKTKWDVLSDGITSRWNATWDMVSSKWNEFKTNFKTSWDNCWRGVGNAFIDTWNSIVGALETAINSMVRMLNKFSVKIPDLDIFGKNAGASIGFNLNPVSFSRVPRLATGAVIPPNAEFAAILGDQRNGRNLEAPERLIRQIVREESGNGSGGNWIIQLVDTEGRVKSETLISEFERKNRREGKTVIPVGT